MGDTGREGAWCGCAAPSEGRNVRAFPACVFFSGCHFYVTTKLEGNNSKPFFHASVSERRHTPNTSDPKLHGGGGKGDI